MLSTILAATITALLNIIARIMGAKMLEKVLTDVLVWGLPKLAAMTTNTLDDALAARVVEALQTPPEDPAK